MSKVFQLSAIPAVFCITENLIYPIKLCDNEIWRRPYWATDGENAGENWRFLEAKIDYEFQNSH